MAIPRYFLVLVMVVPKQHYYSQQNLYPVTPQFKPHVAIGAAAHALHEPLN